MKNTNEGEKPSKGILQTGSKNNASKTRRISWGEIKVKEFTKHDEVNNRSGDEYNIGLNTKQMIIEEKIENEDSFMTQSRNDNNMRSSNSIQNSNSNNIDNKILMNSKINDGNTFLIKNSQVEMQNPFLKNFNLPITNNQYSDDSLRESFDLLNTSKNRLTIKSIGEIFSKEPIEAIHEELPRKDVINSNHNTNINNRRELNNKIENISELSMKNSDKETNEIKILESNEISNIQTENKLNKKITPNNNRLTLNIREELQTILENNLNKDKSIVFNKKTDPDNNNRLTLNLRDELEDYKDNEMNMHHVKPVSMNKRYTFNIQEAIKTLYNTTNDEEGNNSFEEKIKGNKRDSNISASPINIKSNKLYYETCLSSASRCIETTEAKNKSVNDENRIEMDNDPGEDTPTFESEKKQHNSNRITISQVLIDNNLKQERWSFPSRQWNTNIDANKTISPLTKGLNIVKLSNDSSDLDKRIHDLINYIGEKNKIKINANANLEKNIIDLRSKLKDIEQETSKVIEKKLKIKESIEKTDRELYMINDKKLVDSFAVSFYGLKVLSSDFNTLQIQILNQINIKFFFKEFSLCLLNSSNCNLNIEKIKFDIIKLCPEQTDYLIDNSKHLEILKIIYEDIINGIYKPSEYKKILVNNFTDRFKLILKHTGSYLYLLDILNTIYSFSFNFNFTYNKDNSTIVVHLYMINKLGYSVKLSLEIEILNSFLGIKFINGIVSNISLSENYFSKAKLKTISFLEDLKNFFKLDKDKLSNPFFFKDLILKLNENILNL